MKNINFDTPTQTNNEDINFNDWEAPSAPTGRFSGSWADSFSVTPPDATSGNKPFPEYAVIDPNDIGNMMKSLSSSFDVGLGAVKKVVPGVAGFGDLLGGFGRGIETSPAGPALGMFKDAATGFATDLFGAVTRRGGQVFDQFGHTLTDDPVTSIMHILSLPQRMAMTAGLGETGTKLSNGQFDFSTAPRDVMDSIEIASLVPAMKGASMLLKGGSGLSGFARGLTRPLEDIAFSSTSEKAGAIVGRMTLATEGIGLAAEFALPKIAPNEPWARDITSNRVVAEDSPWRFPFEAATSLPMDIVGLYKFGAESRLAAWGARSAFGPAPLPTQIILGKDAIHNAIKGGIITDKQLNLLDDYAFRQTAEDHIVTAWNQTHPGFEAKSIKDLPYTQSEASDVVKKTVNRLMDLYGPKEFGEMASDTIMSEFDGWEGLTEAEQLQQFSDYAELALNYETKFPGTTVSVARETINSQRQAPEAFDYLLDRMNAGDFTNATVNSMKNRYPALSDMLDNIGADPVKLKAELLGITGGRDGILPSLRAQLREAEGRLSTHLTEFDQQASKPPVVGKPIDPAEAKRLADALESTKSAASVKHGFEPDWASESRSAPKTGTPDGYGVDIGKFSQGRGSAAVDRMVVSYYDSKGELAGVFDALTSGPNAGAFKITTRPDLQRQGIAAGMLDRAQKAGFDVAGSVEANRFTKAGRGMMEKYLNSKMRSFADTSPAQANAANKIGDEVLAKYSTKISNEIKNIDNLTKEIGLASSPSLGTMESMLDRLNARIIAGETSLASERATLLGKIKGARTQLAEGINKQILTLHDSMVAREAEALDSPLHEDQMVLDAEFESMQREVSKLNRQYYETQMAGSRWELTRDSRGPMMRLADDTGNVYTRAERTAAGKVFDKLFSGIPNKALVLDAQNYIRNELGRAGNDPKKIQSFLTELHDVLGNFEHEFKTGFKASMFGSIYHLPPQMINRAASKVGLALAEGKTAGEVIYRSYPGPLKIFQNQVLGKAIDIPYNSAFHLTTRSLYPMFRFYFSPRFLAMNLYEAKLIGGGLGGAKFANAPEDKWMLELANKIGTRDSFEVYDRAGSQMARNVAKLAQTKRPDEVVRAIMDTVHAQPEMADFAKQLGTKDKWYAAVSQLMEDRTAIAEYKAAQTTSEKELAAQIESTRADLKGGVGDELINRSKLQRLEQEHDSAIIDRKMAETAEYKALASEEKYQPFLDAIKHNEEKLVESVRQSFVGNPSRSATERVLNSFMLYWPLSYQIKATKLIGEVLFSHAGGFQTGSLGSATYSHMRTQHEQRMQNDPEYANFFNNNKNLLFLMRQLLPITPEDIGVSLSPFVRVPYGIAKGTTTLGQGAQKLATFGPTYDASLIQRILSEQTKPGGLMHDIFGGN